MTSEAADEDTYSPYPPPYLWLQGVTETDLKVVTFTTELNHRDQNEIDVHINIIADDFIHVNIPHYD